MYKLEDIINKVHCADCLDFMKQMPDKCVDLVLTDPPYGIDLDTDFSGMESQLGGYKGKLRGTKYDKVIGDSDFDFNAVWKGLSRICKKHILFGGDYYIDRELYKQGSISIWDKRLDESADKIFGSCFEVIWFHPKRKRGFYRVKWAGLFGMEKENEYHRLHPTQKPIRLIKKLVIEGSDEDDIIFDPFLGSGTTAVAAEGLNRRWIGIEKEPKYCEIARRRLSQVQKEMFT